MGAVGLVIQFKKNNLLNLMKIVQKELLYFRKILVLFLGMILEFKKIRIIMITMIKIRIILESELIE